MPEIEQKLRVVQKMTMEKRLDKIENKIDKLAEAMVSIARAEEKLHMMEEKYNSQYDRMNRFSQKLDDIEKSIKILVTLVILSLRSMQTEQGLVPLELFG